MLKLLIVNIYTTIFFFSAGIFFNNKILKFQKANNLYLYGIYGSILLSFFGLALNFVIALNQNINTAIIIFFTMFFIGHMYKNIDFKKYLKKILYVSLISIILISLANSNRPDAGLYHLPYIQILNQEKIIIGLANIHFRFGTSSIIQYLGAINFNYLFGHAGIVVPLSVLVSFFISFFLEEFLMEKKIGGKTFKLLFIFLTVVFVLYSFNRYSNFGNDATAALTFLLLIYFFLFEFDFKSIDNNLLLKIYLISVFLLTQKLFYVISLLIIFLIFVFDRDKIKYLVKLKLHLPTLLLFLFLFKNIIISGCILYPIKFSCLNLEWLDKETVINESIAGNAWSKDWVNYENTNAISKKEYIKKFIWLNTWIKYHAKVLLEKLLPLFIFLIIFFIFNKGKRGRNQNYQNYQNLNFIISLAISLLGVLIWFLYFPIYRYGIGYIFSSILLIYVFTFNRFFEMKKLTNNFMVWTLIFGFTLFSFKNFNRLYKNYEHRYRDYPFPKIFSFNKLNQPEKLDKDIVKYSYKDEFLFYISSSGICMYNLAPCSYYVNSKVRKKNKYGYKIYYIEN